MRIIAYHFVSYLCVTFFLIALITILIVYTFVNRPIVGARFLQLTFFLVGLWLAAQGLEFAAIELKTKIFWANIQYIPIVLITYAYFVFTLQFTRRESILRRRWLHFVLLIVPVVINILVWTNDSHGLIRRNVYLNLSGPFSTVSKTYGPMFWFFAVYNYCITILTVLNLIKAFNEKMSFYRKQIVLLIVALFFPTIANLMQLTGLNPFNIDITPAFFGISALIITFGIFYYHIFEVVPIARSVIIQEMKAGMIVLDNEDRFLDINPAAQKMFDIKTDHIIGKRIEDELRRIPELLDIIEAGSDNVREIVYNNGETRFYYEISLTRINNQKDNPIGWLLQIYDITERTLAEEIIMQAALHDSLTGLPNRKYFQILFSQELALSRMHGDKLTVAFLDLDNFKTINDTLGHDTGDKVLCVIAERLRAALQESVIVSRIGGDEFAIVLPKIGNDAEIKTAGNLLLSIFEEDVKLGNTTIQVSASIGFSVYPKDGESVEALLQNADKSMYLVKRSSKNNYSIYK